MSFHYPLPPHIAAEHARERAALHALRDAISARIAADLVILDALDGDPDLEPSLGAPTSYVYGSLARQYGGYVYAPGDQTIWAAGSTGDGEDDAGENPEETNEDGGNILDEPHDALDEDTGIGDRDGLDEQAGMRGSRDRQVADAAREARYQLDRIVTRRSRRANRLGCLRVLSASEMRSLGL